MLIKQILKQSREQTTRVIHVKDFSNLQLCGKPEKSQRGLKMKLRYLNCSYIFST